MYSDFKENKDHNLKVRLAKEEYEFVKNKANKSFLSVSEYSRRVLLDEIMPEILKEPSVPDPKLRFNCDHDKEMMRCVLRVYAYAKALAIHTLEEEQFKECAAVAKKQLQEWGYE